MRSVKARKATADIGCMEPYSSGWREMSNKRLTLSAAPLDTQSDYIRTRWAREPYGLVKELSARAIWTEDDILLRMEWVDKQPDTRIADTGQFVDAVSVMMPLHAERIDRNTMGSLDAPVRLWYWRADRPHEARVMTSEGLGTSKDTNLRLEANGKWQDNAWAVVIRCPRSGDGMPGLRFRPGEWVEMAVAVWNGSRSERGPVKAVSEIDAIHLIPDSVSDSGNGAATNSQGGLSR